MQNLDKQIDKIADHMAREFIHELSSVLDKEHPEQNIPNIRPVNPAESCAHILRGLISYHERMTIGTYPERDFYLAALRFALACVEEKIE